MLVIASHKNKLFSLATLAKWSNSATVGVNGFSLITCLPFVKANKVTLRGLNEKLGTNKHFYIAGYTENKTFITESLKVTKD